MLANLAGLYFCELQIAQQKKKGLPGENSPQKSSAIKLPCNCKICLGVPVKQGAMAWAQLPWAMEKLRVLGKCQSSEIFSGSSF